MFVGNYDGLQKGYKICQLSRKIASKSIPFSTISGGIATFRHKKGRAIADSAFKFRTDNNTAVVAVVSFSL